MEGSDGFAAGIDGGADFRFLLRPGRKIAVVGVSDEAVLQAEGVDCLGEVGSERNDAMDGLRDTDRAPDFVSDLAIGGRRLERRWGCLRTLKCRAAKQKNACRRPNHTS